MWKGSPEEREGRKRAPSHLRKHHPGWQWVSSRQSWLLTDIAEARDPRTRCPLHAGKRAQTGLLSPTSGLLAGSVACGPSFSSFCLWTSSARHVVQDGLERQRHHLPVNLRNFWATPHKLEGKSNAKSKSPAIRVWLLSLLTTSVQGTLRSHVHIWRDKQTQVTWILPNQGFLSTQGKFKIKSSGNHWTGYFSYPWAKFEMQNYHKFVYGIHKPADAVYWTFIHKKKKRRECVWMKRNWVTS